jgi:hypothetical protein
MPGVQARRPAGGGADVGDRCVEGVLPEVVGLPPGRLIEQVRHGPATHRCRGEHCVLELLVLPAAEGAFGQEPLPQPFQGQRPGAAGPAPVQRISSDAEEDLAGEGVVAWMQRLQLTQQLEYLGISGQRVEQDPAGGGRVLGVGRLVTILRR